jgi:hypothetical protein
MLSMMVALFESNIIIANRGYYVLMLHMHHWFIASILIRLKVHKRRVCGIEYQENCTTVPL